MSDEGEEAAFPNTELSASPRAPWGTVGRAFTPDPGSSPDLWVGYPSLPILPLPQDFPTLSAIAHADSGLDFFSCFSCSETQSGWESPPLGSLRQSLLLHGACAALWLSFPSAH